MSKKVLLNSKEIEIILHRLACQLVENHNDFSDTVLIGLQPRGSFLAKRLASILTNNYNIKNINLQVYVFIVQSVKKEISFLQLKEHR